MKLKQEHGGVLNDFNDLRLRSSMRSRMSKSYIDELRGTHQQETNFPIDLNNNDNCIHSKSVSISFPTFKHSTKPLCSSCHSTLSLHDIQSNRMESTSSELRAFNKTILLNPNELENLTVEEIEELAYEKDDTITNEHQTKSITILKPAIKNTHNRLTIPTIDDNCIRIPNTLSIADQQKQIEYDETRFSDALGYLRMYKNHNRIQFNSLQFNDREDLQVNQIIEQKRKTRK